MAVQDALGAMLVDEGLGLETALSTGVWLGGRGSSGALARGGELEELIEEGAKAVAAAEETWETPGAATALAPAVPSRRRADLRRCPATVEWTSVAFAGSTCSGRLIL